jgi:hypothetical protein
MIAINRFAPPIDATLEPPLAAVPVGSPTPRKPRDTKGRFGEGNPGGPGRPRRAIEREYLAALSSAVSIDDWRKVCERALRQAIASDAVARAWLTKYVIGDQPMSLRELAAAETAGEKPEDEIKGRAERVKAESAMKSLGY